MVTKLITEDLGKMVPEYEGIVLSIPYLAGFFDGEGSVGIYQTGGRFYLKASISQLDPRPLELAQKLVSGGSIIKDSRVSSLGKRILYKWAIRSDDASLFLGLLYPFLIVKKSQAALGIEFQSLKGSLSVELERDYYSKMRNLKRAEF